AGISSSRSSRMAVDEMTVMSAALAALMPNKPTPAAAASLAQKPMTLSLVWSWLVQRLERFTIGLHPYLGNACSRPSMSYFVEIATKTWMPGTRPGMTAERPAPAAGPRSRRFEAELFQQHRIESVGKEFRQHLRAVFRGGGGRDREDGDLLQLVGDRPDHLDALHRQQLADLLDAELGVAARDCGADRDALGE